MNGKTAEHLFFFVLLGAALYLMWQIIQPFVAPLVLAAIIATVSYPLYVQVLRTVRNLRGVAAFVTVVLIVLTIFLPLSALGYVLFLQAREFYEAASASSGAGIGEAVHNLERALQSYVPSFSLDIAGYARQGAQWLTSHIGDIFAQTATTIFMLFVMLIALFYMLKDGSWFVKKLIALSPLPDSQDEEIMRRLSLAVRSVVLGTLVVALIQGVLTAFGFMLLGIPQPVLWGSVAALGALIPGVGTSFVFIGAIIYALLGGAYMVAIGLLVWGMLAVGLIDNLLGPYLMGRGTELHPLMVLLSVLGGIAFFGPVGFLIGPVALSFFTVLLELYSLHVKHEHHAR